MEIVPEVLPSAKERTFLIRYRERVPGWMLEALKFFSVGVLNTLLDAGLYLVLTRWVWVLPAQKIGVKSLSYSAGILNSFFWNKAWTFHSEVSTTKALLPFILANLAALGINSGLMHLSLNVFDLQEWAALVAATGGTFLWNFTISKFVIFK